jgi:pre-mRNA-splicing factor SYF1
MVVETYNQAIQAVDPQKAKGKPYILWSNFAKFYESKGDIATARYIKYLLLYDMHRAIFEKGTKTDLKRADETASLWCEYAEMELRNQNYEEAKSVLQRACTPPKQKQATEDGKDNVQRKVFRSTKLWAFYADVEESFGTFLTTKAVYDKILDLKVATPQANLKNCAHSYFLVGDKLRPLLGRTKIF